MHNNFCFFAIGSPARVKKHKANNIKNADKYEKQLAQIPALEKELQRVKAWQKTLYMEMQMMQNRGVIHPDYIGYAGPLADYLEKGRADTLKEAINLLEQWKADWDRERAEREHRRKMESYAADYAASAERAAQASERAADSADSAARWSAATTVIAAVEADRQRRRDNSY